MAYIEYNANKNAISIIKMPHRFREHLSSIPSSYPTINLIKKDSETKGVEVENFLSDTELQGFRGEELFKEMLEKNKIPSLYIGQGPSGIEYSDVLKNHMKSNRPDFLVNFPDLGSLFFDVKCRKKFGISNNHDSKYFCLYRGEAEALIKLQEQLLTPVWVAFLDANLLEGETIKLYKFHLLPISLFKKFQEGVNKLLGQCESDLICVYRIPDSLLTTIHGELLFKVKYHSIPEETLTKMGSLHKDIIQTIEEEIKQLIRRETILKSHLFEEIFKVLPFAFRLEVETILTKLIDEKSIHYEARQPLEIIK